MRYYCVSVAFKEPDIKGNATLCIKVEKFNLKRIIEEAKNILETKYEIKVKSIVITSITHITEEEFNESEEQYDE